MKMTNEQKVLAVLEKINDQHELNPKEDYLVRNSRTGYTHSANSVRFNSIDFARHCRVDFTELEKILANLQQQGLIEDFRFVSEYV